MIIQTGSRNKRRHSPCGSTRRCAGFVVPFPPSFSCPLKATNIFLKLGETSLATSESFHPAVAIGATVEERATLRAAKAVFDDETFQDCAGKLSRVGHSTAC